MYKYALVCIICSILYLMENNKIIIETNQGQIQGKYWKTREGKTFIGFTGIRYAQPPVGPLRFKAPIPVKPWLEIVDATKNHAVCPQVNYYSKIKSIIGNEDCLFLNVYIPKLPKYISELLPVMFYIHGGSFVMGSGRRDYIGPDILLDKDIILVTANYRLGALGFLSTGDEWASGNNGLKDQSLAIHWVKRNIIRFGGDSQRITVFGNSAGAACAHYHMISPLSRNLLNRAITQSGSAYAHYALSHTHDAIKNAFRLGELLNCSSVFSKELIKCLRKVDVYKIINQERKFSTIANDTTIPFRVVVEENREGAFLIEDPLVTIKAGRAANIPFMTGIVTDEGAYKVAELKKVPGISEYQNVHFHDLSILAFGFDSDTRNITEALKTFYFGNKPIDDSNENELINLFTDGIFLWALDTTVKLHFQYSRKPVYQYLFGYRGSVSHTGAIGDTHHYGVSHSDELLYLFALRLVFPEYKPTYADRRIIKLMTTLWTNFAKTGNPTPQVNSIIPVKWNPVESEHQEYYYIKDYNNLGMAKDLYYDRTKLWRSLPVRKKIIKH